MANVDYLKELIDRGQEERFLEYKESAPWDALKEKIAKTALGMANLRDGGTVIIGVSQRGGKFTPEGAVENHIETYDGDKIQEFVNSYADPYVRLELHSVEHRGKKFLALVIHEFDTLPVVCKKNRNELRQGAIYTRSNRKPETCEVQSQTEMREIIEMATLKNAGNLIQTIQHLGIPLRTDTDEFEEQLKEFVASKERQLETIKDAPHWEVILKPSDFQRERIPKLSDCWAIIESCRVVLRGWDYPHLSNRCEERANGNDWIASWSDFHPEYWRLYQSGLFVHVFSFHEDSHREEIEKQHNIGHIPQGFKPSGYVDVISTLSRTTEIFEFARRLVEKNILGASLSIKIRMIGSKDRVLFVWDPGRAWWGFHHAGAQDLGNEWVVKTEELLGKSNELALNATVWFFERFDWMNPPLQILKDDQRKFLERRI